MKDLTFRTNNSREHDRTVRVRSKPLEAQKPYLSGRHMWRRYYYAKSVRGGWSSAERSSTGMRWNYFLSHGRTTPQISPIEPIRTMVSEGLMSRIKVHAEREQTAQLTHTPRRSNRTSNSTPTWSTATEPEADRRTEIIPIARHPQYRRLRIVNDRIDSGVVTEISTHPKYNPKHEHESGEAPPVVGAVGNTGPEIDVPTIIVEPKTSIVQLTNIVQLSPQTLQPQKIEPELRAGCDDCDERAVKSPEAGVPSRTEDKVEQPTVVFFRSVIERVSDLARVEIPILGKTRKSTVQPEIHADTHANTEFTPRKGPGYISSAQRRVFQLKVTMADAEPPR